MKTCWVVSSDKKGTINQAIGIPERLGFDCEVKIVKLTWIDKFLGHINPRFLSYCKQINSLASQRQPDLIISAGHDGLIVNSALKTRNKNIINVHIQNPKRLGKYFDLIITSLQP